MSADYSVTDLIKPPRIVQLQRRYKDVLDSQPKDAMKQIASFKGNAIHSYLESMLWRFINKNPNSGYLIERRLWDRINGRKISGKFDCYLNEVMYDFKTTSTWKKIFGDFTDWEIQLNIYAYLLRLCGVKVSRLVIIAWYTNWDKFKLYERGYPKAEIEEIEISNLWSTAAQRGYLNDLIEYHKINEALSDEELLPCTESDMWSKDTQYAVYKYTDEVKGPKAARLLSTQEEAEQWITDKGEVKGARYETEVRPGARTRCEEWCDVSQFCNQYMHYKGDA